MAKILQPIVGDIEFMASKLEDAIFVTSENIMLEERMPGKWQERWVRIQTEDGVERINLYGRTLVITDDNYVLITVKSKRFAIETSFVNPESTIRAACVGSHGGMNNHCDDCILNAENIPPGTGKLNLHVDTMPCTLSKHYFNRPYWFQKRIEVKEIH
ncbi:hypothetical protein [Vibrio phage vB_pir03]|nr:hypothetical protein [Vibrio phage vB_pir03]